MAYTIGDIAQCSVQNDELLYKLFGVNAELLIDHAWGWDPCTIADIKAYKPSTNSTGSGQVLQYAYTADKARLVIREMADALALDLADKKLVTDQLTITVGYAIENLTDSERRKRYHGEVTTDAYGRSVPKHAHGTANLPSYSASARQMLSAIIELYDRIVDRNLLVRRLNITANHVIAQNEAPKGPAYEQLDLFTDYAEAQALIARRKNRSLTEKRKCRRPCWPLKRNLAKTPYQRV